MILYSIAYMLGDTIYESIGLKMAFFYLAIEIIFFVYYRKRTREIQKFGKQIKLEGKYKYDCIEEFMYIISLNKSSFLGWFQYSDLNDIKTGNVQEFIGWALFGETPLNFTNEDREEIKNIIYRIESILNYKFDKGYNINVKSMRNSIDPIKVVWRPLIFYILIKIADYIQRLLMKLNGFENYTAGCLRYWYRPNININKNTISNTNTNAQPLVYIHGLGAGLLYNLGMITHLSRNRDTFVLELPWVSLQLGENIIEPEQFVQCLECMYVRHGIIKACIVSHSYGTCVTSWILRLHPTLISSIILVEPVALNLCDPSVCWNFIYKKPNKFISSLVRALIGCELATIHTLSRNFFWADNIILYKDLPELAAVFVSSYDHIIDAPLMKKWLEKKNKESDRNIELQYYTDKIDHAHLLFSIGCYQKISQLMEEYDQRLDHSYSYSDYFNE